MTRTRWPSPHTIWLSTLLTVVYAFWTPASNGEGLEANQVFSCAKLLSDGHAAAPPSITQFIDKNGVSIEIQGHRKSAFLAPEDSWGRGENAKHLFVLAMRVGSNEEGLQIFNQIISQNNSAHGTQWPSTVKADNIFEVPGVLTARIHPPYYARHIPMAQGRLELEVEINKTATEVNIAAQIGATLIRQFDLRILPTDLEHLVSYDLSTYEGRAAWGYEAFHEWLINLSSDARKTLKLISGPDYRDILPFLRGAERNGRSSLSTSQLQSLVSELDAAIDRGQIPVPVRLYRASSDPFSLDAWTQLSVNNNTQVQQLSDAAYTFTSLDEEFAQSWNQHELRGNGIIIEIEAKAGTRAGYVDRGPETRDYAEIILARGQKLTPLRAYTTASGEKRLVVTTP